MSRQPFNTDCDIWYGPAGVAPNAFRGTFPCRLVEEDGIFSIGNDAPNIPYYLTIDAIQPDGIWSGKLGIGTYSRADLVAVPSGSLPRFRVLFVDIVDWKLQPTYFRAYLVEAANYLPEPCGFVMALNEACPIFVRPSVRMFSPIGSVWAGSAVVLQRPKATVVDATSRESIVNGYPVLVYTPGSPPTDYWLDTFTDSDGTALTSHTPEVGTSYYNILGTFEIQSNQLVCLSTSFDLSTQGFDPGVDTWQGDVDFSVQTGANDPNDRFVRWYFRSDDVSEAWCIEIKWLGSNETTGGFDIIKSSSGVETIEASGSVTLSTDTVYTIHLDVDPAGISCTIAGVNASVTDGFGGTNTKMHLQVLSVSPTSGLPMFDNLHVYA